MAYLNGEEILFSPKVHVAPIVVDQTYDPTSENPQSGIAVAQAIASVGGEKEWELLEDITLTDAIARYDFDVAKMNAKNEIHIEGYILATDSTATSPISFNDNINRWQSSINFKTTGKALLLMDIYKSPRNITIFDGTVSPHIYTVTGGSFKTSNINENLSTNTNDEWVSPGRFSLFILSGNSMAAGTRIKVWGR